MKDLLEYIVKSLVTKPDEVKITEETLDNVVNFKINVFPEDIGIVIGKAGQTIKAIRRLLVVRALAENRNLQININLEEVK